jgi:hypothetical protein
LFGENIRVSSVLGFKLEMKFGLFLKTCFDKSLPDRRCDLKELRLRKRRMPVMLKTDQAKTVANVEEIVLAISHSPAMYLKAHGLGGHTSRICLVTAGVKHVPLHPVQKVRVVSDERPSPNVMAFERAILTDCCHGADLSYEILVDISDCKGPGIRFLNSELKRWTKLKRYPQIKRVHRQAVWALAKLMKAGLLRKPILKPGEQWWNQIEYIGLADMDIDGGRTAQATLTDIRSGQTTFMDEWGAKGAFWRTRIRQAIAEVIFIQVECIRQSQAAGLQSNTITPERCFPDRFTNALPIPPQDPNASIEEPPADPGDDPEQTS